MWQIGIFSVPAAWRNQIFIIVGTVATEFRKPWKRDRNTPNIQQAVFTLWILQVNFYTFHQTSTPDHQEGGDWSSITDMQNMLLENTEVHFVE